MDTVNTVLKLLMFKLLGQVILYSILGNHKCYHNYHHYKPKDKFVIFMLSAIFSHNF